MVQKCTPAERVELVDTAKASLDPSGNVNGCHFKKMAREFVPDVSNDIQKSDMTGALAYVLYKDERYSGLTVGFYDRLFKSLGFLNKKYGSLPTRGDFVTRVFIKGANAIALQQPGFEFSDMDIGVYINPTMSEKDFETVHAEVRIIVGRLLAAHKRAIDATFFLRKKDAQTNDKRFDYAILNESITEDFKIDHVDAMFKVGATSCLFADEIRNACSRNSIYITPTKDETELVRIDIPHMLGAETIPLNRTPVPLSVNDSIKYSYEFQGESRNVNFDLYRLKWCSVYDNEVSSYDLPDGPSSDSSSSVTKMAADFIDITIPKWGDFELVDFEERWGFVRNSPLTAVVHKFGFMVTVSSKAECIYDLQKGISVYTNVPEAKIAKKMRVLQILTE